MLKKIKYCNNLIVFFLMNVLFNLIVLPLSNAQENYLLSAIDFSGQKLLKQSKIHWGINNENGVIMGTGQKWSGNGDNQRTYIQYCKFNNESEAFIGTAYAAVKSNATPFIWGSFNGSIIADGSWISIRGRAIYFVRGNMGVKIFKPGNFNETDTQLLSSISSKLVAKIDSHLEPVLISNEEKAKQKQISLTKFDAITGRLIVLDSYSPNAPLDSKWIIDSNSFALGKRKEWTNEKGLKVVIDICQFDNTQDAITAGGVRSKSTYLYDRLIDLEKLNSMISILKEWQEKYKHGLPKTSFSVVGTKGNKAVHFYLFAESGIDTDLFHSIFKELSLKL